MTGAQALIESLKREQVAHIFGYAGATICPAVDALKSHPEIGYTLVRTEQNAGHMASGYARISGKVGVCMVTSGPGATNLITGIATAYMDSIPMVAITGQVPSNLLGRDIFQEVDITGAVAPFSKHSYLVKDANDIPRIVKEAFHIASTGRPGPVLIDIPIDVQEQSLKKFYYPEEVSIRGYKPSVKGNDLQIKRVVEAIRPLQTAFDLRRRRRVAGRRQRGAAGAGGAVLHPCGQDHDGAGAPAHRPPAEHGDDRGPRQPLRQQGPGQGGPAHHGGHLGPPTGPWWTRGRSSAAWPPSTSTWTRRRSAKICRPPSLWWAM